MTNFRLTEEEEQEEEEEECRGVKTFQNHQISSHLAHGCCSPFPPVPDSKQLICPLVFDLPPPLSPVRVSFFLGVKNSPRALYIEAFPAPGIAVATAT